jgi:hypothetical protein
MNRSTFDIVSSYQIDVNKCFDILFKIAFGNISLKYGTCNNAGTVILLSQSKRSLQRLYHEEPAPLYGSVAFLFQQELAYR